MNLDELLSYNPHKKAGTKRQREEERGEQNPPKAPRSRLKDGVIGAASVAQQQQDALSVAQLIPEQQISGVGEAVGMNGVSDEEKLRLLQSMDDEDDSTGEEFDAGAVKRMLLSLEKKVLKNQEMRVKFPDMPEKFMESEIELNIEIQKLHEIATVPKHYPILIETNSLQTMLGLISHDNSDISISIIDLMQELTDEGAESEEELAELVETLLREGNLERLDEKVKEDYDGVHNTLAIVENMCEIKNTEVCIAGGEQGLLAWLLKRVRVRQYDNNKLYASEILAILLQGGSDASRANQQLLGDRDGIDILLQSLAYYKKRDPGSSNEIEMMENLFDSLCSALMFISNRERFLKGEGLQLMILMLKGKKFSRVSALKVLDHAMCNKEGKDNCIKFIDVYGLRSVFPAFMKPPKRTGKLDGGEKEHEEHVCSILVSLFKHVQGAQYDRLVNKFVENDFEKVDRLMELHFKYQRKVKESHQQSKYLSVSDEEDEIDKYLRRLDAGLLALQIVNFIIAKLCTCSVSAIGIRIKVLLNQHGDSLASVKKVLQDHASNITSEISMGEKNSTVDKDSEEHTVDEKTILMTLANSLQI